MGPRSVAVALALTGPLMLGPAPVWAEVAKPAPQTGTTEVTVDLSGLAGDPVKTPGGLAQTADLQTGGAVVLCATGALAAGTGHLLRRADRRDMGV